MRYLVAVLAASLMSTFITGLLAWIFILPTEVAWFVWIALTTFFEIAALVLVTEDP